MGCSLKKEKQISTININEQKTYYFVIMNGEKELKKFKKASRFPNSIPILGSIGIIQHSVKLDYSTIIQRRNKLFQTKIDRNALEMQNIEILAQQQQKK
ncbi:unnamed protein product (macronuclear) [Paramecium tetraurelia]|uniref:Uncharacterized protein n=1 Tax=Paramecium tetraurelia TaxID=5888 RepID=A0CKA1_PARTE|nr:uncharacterized protein GSPATT00000931001 [Paramecium tetraurelia]CAK71218.1 unnamed protein product [Paramecium tetraurelia]|eukprot:XP_001438615.1 hypothetical protein (macronuclear) [Paramecium tetraurelia strain d4-2]